MGKRLIAKEDYILPNRNLYYKRGIPFEPDDETFLFLMADAPGVFEVVEEKAIAAPPADKMLRTPKAKK